MRLKNMKLKKAISPDDHVRGSAEAPVTLVEYGDYESPACCEAYYMVRALQAEMGEQLQFVFRNFPLTSIHPFADYASLAAEAAGAQGKFWEIHDFLFENPGAAEDDRLTTYAWSIGIEANRFDREIAEDKHADHLQEDIISGIQSGVNGTPTFFINGVRHEGAWNFELLVVALKAARAVHDDPTPKTVHKQERFLVRDNQRSRKGTTAMKTRRDST
ncbi:MAG: oxidoreductase [Chthonomonadaceae bacterium]|nr:oxidoreductase [Chthonomonadaceae bacterium]